LICRTLLAAAVEELDDVLGWSCVELELDVLGCFRLIFCVRACGAVLAAAVELDVEELDDEGVLGRSCAVLAALEEALDDVLGVGVVELDVEELDDALGRSCAVLHPDPLLAVLAAVLVAVLACIVFVFAPEFLPSNSPLCDTTSRAEWPNAAALLLIAVFFALRARAVVSSFGNPSRPVGLSFANAFETNGKLLMARASSLGALFRAQWFRMISMSPIMSACSARSSIAS
jgi:hypothetical protein